MRKLILATLAFLISFTAISQDFSNKGKEFWLAYSYHVGMVNAGGSPAMTLYLTSDVATTYSVDIYNVGSLQTGSIAPNQVISVVIPNSYFINADGLFTNKAIHVTAAKPIVVYSFITRSQASAASLCLPTNVLGKEYYAMSFTQNSNEANACSYITIVAVEDNTNVEIIPKATTKGGWAANTQHNVTLNKGEVYQVLGTTTGNTGVDLSGTSVKAVATAAEGCKRIAVFSGSGKIAIGCANGSADNLYQQLYPANSWGVKYLTIPSYSRPYTYYRVMKSDPATNVYVNGVLVSAASFTNGYYQFNSSTPSIITSDIPISVTQYFTSQNCLGNASPYDPDMVVLNPVEQNISKVTLVSSPLTAAGAQQHHLHVIMKNSGTGISSFKFDGTAVAAGSWVIHPQDPTYSYLYIPNVNPTSHTLSSDSGFNALAYGYGNAETYAYSAGTNVKDLYQQIGVSSQYGIETTPSVCSGSPFRFKVSLPYLADSLYWDLSGLPAPTPPNVMVHYPPSTVDSTTIVNNKTIYWYSLPTPYTVNTIGTYPINITAYSPTSIGGCGTTQDIDFDLEVSAPPVAAFTFTSTGCVNSPIQFNDATVTTKPTYKWDWDFGDPASGASNKATIKNPVHTYTQPGTYTITFSTITTPGCLSDTLINTGSVVVTAIPAASFTKSTPVCAGSPVTFTDASTVAAPATLNKWYWDFGDGNTTIATSTATASQVHTYTNWTPTLTVSLIAESNSGCKSPAFTSSFKVNPVPFVDFTLPGGICLPGSSTFTSTSTIADGTQAGFSYLWDFGDPGSGASNTAIINPSTHIFSGAPPAGGFLVDLKITSAAGCIHDTVKALSTVYPQPHGAYTAPAPVCQGTAMNFTSSSDPLAGNTVATYYWDFGDGTGIISPTPPTSPTISHTYASSGTFTVKHWIVTDKGCSSDTAIHTVTINVIPVISSIAHSNPTTCSGVDGTITLSGLAAGTSYTINFDKNGIAQTPLILVAGATGTVVMTGLNAATYANINVTADCTSSNAATQILSDPAPPAAPIASGTPTLCTGSNISLTASSPAAGASYAWTGPNAFSSNLQNPVIVGATLAAAGNYYVTVTSANCTSPVSAAVVVVVNETPAISSAVPSNPTTCSGTDGFITLSGLVSGQSYTVNYQKNSVAQPVLTLVASASGTVIIPNLASGTYSNIYVTTNGCSSANAPVLSLSDPSAPAQPNASSNSPICAGSTLNLTVNSPLAGGVYTWSGPAGFNSNLTNPAITNATTAAGGTYSVYVTLNNCVSATQSFLVVVNANPIANFSNSAPTCESKTISFTDLSVPNSGTVNTWAWDFGDPASASNTSTLQNPTHSFAAASVTPYVVKLTVTTDKGCSSALFSKPVTVNPNPVAGFIVPAVCLNDVAALFTDTSKIAAPATITSWLWNFNDPTSGPLNTSTAQNGSHKYTLTGLYHVSLTVTSNSGCANTIIEDIFINGATPTSNFTVTNAATLCGNDSVSITNISTVNPGSITRTEIYWDNLNFPLPAGPNYTLDNSPFFNKIYKHKYPSLQVTKTYSIRFRAYSGTLCVNDKFLVITVNAVPKVQFNALPDICFDAAPYQITQASETGGVPGSAVYSGPGVSPTGLFSPAVAGVGTAVIKYTYASTAAGCTDTMTQTIKVIDTASANFTVSAIRCEKKAITFTDNSTSPAGTITTWTWNFGDGTGPVVKTTAAPFTYIYSSTGTYNVTLTVTTSNGCKSTVRTVPVTVSPLPAPGFNMPVACLPNANVTFNNLSAIADGSAMTYLWDFGDPLSGSNTSTGVNGNHIFNSGGPFNISLMATSAAGCDSTIVKPYSDLHPQPVADFSIANPAGVCLGTAATFTDNSSGADGMVTNWVWDLGDGSPTVNQSGTSTPVNYTYGDTLLYTVKLSITNNFGCKNDVSKQFLVHAYPIVSAGPDRFVLEGGSIQLQSVATGNDLTYLWLPATFLNDPTIPSPTVTKVTSDITYTLVVTARGGCSASDAVFVKLLKFPVIPNTFTPNNDGINDLWTIDYLDTYPDNWVQVFNRYGQLVFESHGYAKPWDGTYKGKPLPVGTYYYIIEPKNGRAPLTGYVTILK